MGASTNSTVNRMRFNGYDFAAIADFGLLENAVSAARKKQIKFKVGNIYSADLFYMPDPEIYEVMEKIKYPGYRDGGRRIVRISSGVRRQGNKPLYCQ